MAAFSSVEFRPSVARSRPIWVRGAIRPLLPANQYRLSCILESIARSRLAVKARSSMDAWLRLA